MRYAGLPLIAILCAAASVTAAEPLSVRAYIQGCAQDREWCEGYTRATIDWYRSEIGKPGREFWPYCLRPGDDDAKVLMGLIEWFFTAHREEYERRWPDDPAWDEVLGYPVQDFAVSILPSAYPCADFDYPPEFADFAAGWMGYDEVTE